jgi:polysaccharide pyruvyl transferase WcaK-like protein
MNILLHGADSGSNFGDYLFADIFYKKIEECNPNGRNLFFECGRFGIGQFFKKNMQYTKKQKIRDIFKSDLLVFFSGGYFGERKNTAKQQLKRFLRYIPIGLIFILRKKPIVIIGIGGGPISSKILRRFMCCLMEYAAELTVRDIETAEYYIKSGVKREIKVTSDTAQIVNQEMLPDLLIKEELDQIFSKKKRLFLHILNDDLANQRITEKLIDPINKFLMNNPEYGVILGCDSTHTMPVEDMKIYQKLNCNVKYPYHYESPWQLGALLNTVDLIITTKLHVGIIGSTLSKSVLSFPIHPEKTKRYYKQINQQSRCIPISDVSKDEIEEILNQYHNQKITLPEEIRAAAQENIKTLEKAIIRIGKHTSKE